MPKKSKNKLFPRDLQNLVFEYADIPREKHKSFKNEDNEWVENNMLNNAADAVILPSYLLGAKIYSHESKARRRVAYATGIATGVVLAFTAGPLVALGTGLRDLSLFAKRKHSEAPVKALFDADLVKRIK